MSMKVKVGGGTTTGYQESQAFGAQGTGNTTGYGSITQAPVATKSKEPGPVAKTFNAVKNFFRRENNATDYQAFPKK